MKFHVTVGGREFVVELSGNPGGEGTGRSTEARVDARVVSLKPLKPPAIGEGPGLEILAQDGTRHLTVSLPSREAAEEGGAIRLLVDNRPASAHVETERDRLRATAHSSTPSSGSATATSSLPGVIRRILLEAGDPVKAGTPILTLEAMKMENDVRAETAGKVKTIFVKEGQVVNAGDPLAEIEKVGTRKES